MTTIALELDGVAHEVDSSLWRVWLQRTAGSPIAIVVDPTKTLSWSTLDQLAGLSELSYDGRDDGVIAYVQTRSSIKHLMWTGHSSTTIDVRGSSLSQLGVDPLQPRFDVRTPKTLRELRIYAPKKKGSSTIAVEDPQDGAELALTLFGTKTMTVTGVDKLATLRFWFAREVDLARWRKYSALRELEIMGDPTCSLKSTKHLASFTELTKLTLRNCYDLDAEKLPDAKKLPKLARLEVNGTTKEIADALRSKLGGVPSIEITGVRTAAWLAVNLDNPFREWEDEYGARVGAAASKAWKSTMKELAAIEKKPTSTKVKACFIAFVKAFNVLDQKPGLDTIQAEQISDAYDKLLERASKTLGKSAPSDEMARGWFEQVRTF